ncbi:SIR2 family protein [Corallococcus exiguus]|uniref:P-loop NTPase n=1 Tax=Corallococcus exiguus TaxID=83462 RepID=UPI001560A7F2|nr:SIR2 family protein [Corallococcus exiguus]NRD54466.1 SIR2 family protein [Corallococcus exiguus]
MLPDSIKPSVIAALRRGRYSLLLGAGFSADSTNSTGESLPVGDRLKNDIAKAFGLEDYYPLAMLAGAVPAETLGKFFEQKFKGCVASERIRIVSQFVWKSIYSFNVDDVLVSVYGKESKQVPKWLTFKHMFYSPRDPGELTVVQLHGSVLHPEHGYIFSPQEYGNSSALDSTWFKIAADELVASPFIVVGFGMNEPDLEYYLARRTGLGVESQQIAPSLYITNKMDAVKRRACERFGLEPIEANASDFFEWLHVNASPLPEPIELVAPSLKGNEPWLVRVAASDVRMFFRQWLQVSPGSLPEALSSAESSHLLQGVEPRWHHFKDEQDIVRFSERKIIREVSQWVSTGGETQHTVLVSGDPGEGKSTALKRVALELAESGVLVFFFNVSERLLVDSATAVLMQVESPMVLMVDQVAEHGHQFSALVEQLSAAGKKVFAIAAERTQRLFRVTDSLVGLGYKDEHLRHLDKSEALALTVKLRQAGLLGRSSRKSDEVLATGLVQKSLFVGLVVLNEDVPQLKNVVQSEMQDFDSDARLVYAIFSLAHSCGYPLKMSLAQRASGVDSGSLSRLLKTSLRGLLKGLPPAGEYRETRHRIVAEAVVRELAGDELFGVYVRLAKTLAPYVNTKTLTDGTPEARLSARLLDFDDMVEPLLGKTAAAFYEEIKKDWAWNSRYWDQVALMKLDRDPLTALKHAEQSVAIEFHPVSLTNLSKIRFRLAKIQAGTTHGARYLTEAIQSTRDAIRLSGKRQRREIQPFDVGIRGIVAYYRALPSKKSFELDPKVRDAGNEFADLARRWFSDKDLRSILSEWDQLKDESIR